MILRPIRLALFVFIMLISLGMEAQKVLITDTRSEAATQFMDLSWKRASNMLGADPEIIAKTYLDSLHILQEADLVIVASGVSETTSSQRNALLQYVQGGGNVYVQSEFKINFAGNQLFSYLVNKSGGEFSWEGETSSNLNPTTFPSFISGGNSISELKYFWNGTYGCGGKTVFPIATHNDLHYGFIHINTDPNKGRIMTTSDQDWIKIATEVGQEHRLQLMKNLLNTLANGVDKLVTPDIRISFLQQSLCPGTPFDIEAKIDETVLDYQVNWFKNGNLLNDLSNKVNFESYDLKEGDLLQAKIAMLSGCSTTDIESNIVQIERVFPLSMSIPSITGSTMVCAGEKGIFVAEIEKMPDPAEVTYTWTIDDIDQEVNNDSLIINNPIQGSIIALQVSFNDGCTMVNNTIDPVTIEVIGKPIPMISLTQNKTSYCNGDLAVIEVVGISQDYDFTVEWHVDGQNYNDNTITYELPSLTNDHELFASVSYSDPCQGLMRLSTQVSSVTIDQPTLRITDKQNTSCDIANGSITVQPEGGTEPYNFQWNAKSVNSTITDLPMGMQTIKMIDSNGCTAEVNTSIGAADPKIIDSLIVMNQSCDQSESALVQLYTNPSFKNGINIKWINGDGNSVNGDFAEGEFAEGQYTVTASINESCTEERNFKIQSEDLLDRMTKSFDTEAEFFVTLDLGISPDLIESIVWSGDNEKLNCTDCAWPTVMATKSLLLQVALETTSGCAYAFDVTVNVSTIEKPPYFAPSGFSPDGDDKNEQFEFFTDPTIASLQELLIFDRWGNMVYEAQEMNSTVHWDGSVNGNPAERGIYVYVAKMLSNEGEEIAASGSVMLVR